MAEYAGLRKYFRQLELAEGHLDALLADTDAALDLLDSLTKSFKDVKSQTSVFQNQCEGLLKEQARVEGLADQIDHNLKYYNYLEPATRRLNAPSAGNFVKSEEFSEMLSRIDECLKYMEAHVCRSHDHVIEMLMSGSKGTAKLQHTSPGFDFL